MRVSFCFHLVVPQDTDVGAHPQGFRVFQALRDLVTKRILGKTKWESRVPVPPLPKLPLHCRRDGRFSVLLLPESEQLLRSLQLHVLVNFTNHILRGEILSIPEYGVWSYHHGDPREFRGFPPGFWEIYQGAPYTGAILQKLEHRLDDGVVLRKLTFPTIHHSYYRQREALFSISVPWLSEVARDILSNSPPPMNKTETEVVGPIYTRATNPELLRFLGILLRNKLRRLFKSGRRR